MAMHAQPRPAADCVAIDFTIGRRRIVRVRRRLLTVAYDLLSLLEGIHPAVPPLPEEADGYRFLSVPQRRLAEIREDHSEFLVSCRQLYRRHYIAMTGTFDEYLAKFSSRTRSTLARKARKVAELNGGALDISEYRTPREIDTFFDHAGALSARTYQERMLDAGLPCDGLARAEAKLLAEQDRLRAFLLFIGGRPASYLFLPIEAGTIHYAFLGYDPDYAKLSAGTVLQLEALKRLFAEGRYRYFDFTEGEGSHKQLFATGHVDCARALVLKRTAANRVLLAGASTFDRAVEAGSALADRIGARTAIRRLLRA